MGIITASLPPKKLKLKQERKYNGPIMMMIYLDRIKHFLYWLLLNIFFSPIAAFFALIIAVGVHYFSRSNYILYLKIENHFSENQRQRNKKKEGMLV
jgi:CPA2 family monovalent cation:H+ antiporter-2